jgi:RHS repeat-associated protein
LFPIDSNGNLTQKTEGTDVWGYEWSANNELTRVTKNSVEQARFSYDPLGRRVEKVASGVTTTYTYDGDDIIREVRGATTLRFVHGLEVDEPLAVDDGIAISYLHADVLSSVVKVTNASGAVTFTRRYDAWGNLELGVSEPGYSFTGREWNPEVGLYYYRARYYDPQMGRFINEDPIGLAGGINLFAYVNGRPVSRRDPRGLQTATTAGPADSSSCTIECDGQGNVTPTMGCLNQDIAPCLGFCTMAHERVHAEDATQSNPAVCVGQPAHTQVAFRGGRAKSEKRAYTTGMACLYMALWSQPTDCDRCNASGSNPEPNFSSAFERSCRCRRLLERRIAQYWPELLAWRAK